jgi:hypothetical protein
VQVQVVDDVGYIPRPNLLGALVSKAAAYAVPSGRRRERHLIDFAVLASLISRSDRIAEQMTTRDRRRLVSMLGALATSRGRWVSVTGADRGVAVLGQLVATD